MSSPPAPTGGAGRLPPLPLTAVVEATNTVRAGCDLAARMLAETRAELERELRWWGSHGRELSAAARSVTR